MSESKTGRKAAAAAAAMNQKAKTVITEEQYVKNLRDDLANARYVSQEGARALLARFDRCVQDNVDLQVKLGEALIQADRWREEAGKESEQMHEYAQQVAALQTRVEDLEKNLDASRERVLALEAEKTQNAEIAKSAPFADQLWIPETPYEVGAVVVGVDLANGSDRAVVVEPGLAPAEQGKDSIGD